MELYLEADDDSEDLAAQLYESDARNLDQCPACESWISGLVLHEDLSWRCPMCYTRFHENTIIRVKALDTGDYPPEIGSAMTGLFLLSMKTGYQNYDSMGRWIKREEMYKIPMSRLLVTLEMRSPVAYDWYLARDLDPESALFFRKREVEEIMTVLEVEPSTWVDEAIIQDIIKNQNNCLEGTNFAASFCDF